MIFGFNTDIKHEDTVYHVQSEAREMSLPPNPGFRARPLHRETGHFLRGKAIPGFNDQNKEQILRDQHRLVLDAVRDGKLDTVMDKRETPETLATIKELDVEWLNADSVHKDHTLHMHFRVTEAGAPVQGARLTFRFARPDTAPFYTQVLTDASGNAEMRVDMDEASLPDSSVLVQATHAGRSATRKFRLRKVEA